MNSLIRRLFASCFPLAGMALAVTACSDSSPESEKTESGKPVVHTVNYPLHYFAERIAGDLIDLHFAAPEDEDPAFWKPSDEVVLAMQGADLILLNGADYAKWAEHATLPDSILVDTSTGFAESYIEVEDAVKHSHGDGEEHSHDGVASITWIDFDQARQQAEAVRDALKRLLPDAGSELDERSAALATDLKQLDEAMQVVARRIGDRPLVASHPVYQYWSRRYGIALESVHWEPDDVPGEEGVEELKAVLADHPATWMIWEGEPEKESVRILAEMGIQSVVFDPCGNRPESGHWLEAMQENLENLKAIVE